MESRIILLRIYFSIYVQKYELINSHGNTNFDEFLVDIFVLDEPQLMITAGPAMAPVIPPGAMPGMPPQPGMMPGMMPGMQQGYYGM